MNDSVKAQCLSETGSWRKEGSMGPGLWGLSEVCMTLRRVGTWSQWEWWLPAPLGWVTVQSGWGGETPGKMTESSEDDL